MCLVGYVLSNASEWELNVKSFIPCGCGTVLYSYRVEITCDSSYIKLP